MNTYTIPNIQDFRQQIINGDLIIERLVPFITEESLFQKPLRGSTITECKINNEIININKYKKLLIHIYSTTNIETILQNTILNISQQEIYAKGFYYNTRLGLSIQGADSRRTLKEIINIIKIKGYNMEIKIKLTNDEEIACFIV